MPIHLFKFNKIIAGPGLGSGTGRAARKGIPAVRFNSYPMPHPYYILQGLTVDSAGSALGSCDVDLFVTSTDLLVDRVISDVSGNYLFKSLNPTANYYAVAYKSGSPDVFGTTVNTLVGSAYG